MLSNSRYLEGRRMTATQRWIVRLAGNDADLEELPFWFPSGMTFAFTEGREVYIASERFEPSMSAFDVAKVAQTLMDEWNAIVALIWAAFIPPTIDNVIEETSEGRRVHHVLAVANCAGRSKVRAVLSGSTGPTQAQVLVEKAKSNPVLGDAVTLWALSNRNWPRLYRILEELERYLGMTVVQAEICTAKERGRFTASANNAAVAGVDSRHAGGKFAPPINPMSFDDADAFIRNMLKICLMRP